MSSHCRKLCLRAKTDKSPRELLEIFRRLQGQPDNLDDDPDEDYLIFGYWNDEEKYPIYQPMFNPSGVELILFEASETEDAFYGSVKVSFTELSEHILKMSKDFEIPPSEITLYSNYWYGGVEEPGF